MDDCKVKKHTSKKKHKKDKHRRRKRSSSSESSSTEDEWVEKQPQASTETSTTVRSNDWLQLPSNFLTISNQERRSQKEAIKRDQKQKQYDPCSNVRELNPYWKDNGTGLPSFKKPNDDFHEVSQSTATAYRNSNKAWKKKPDVLHEKNEEKQETVKVMNNQELNALAAKVVKAEIMGNTSLAAELSKQLNSARKLLSESNASSSKESHIILTQTDSRGFSRPLQKPDWKKRRQEEIDSNDDKHSLKRMFEQERFSSSEKQDKELFKIMSKAKNDDVDELFADNVNKEDSEQKQRDRAIAQQEKVTRSLDNCPICPASAANVNKHLIIATGSNVFLSLPAREPLVQGHCLLSPLKHIICSTQLDEDDWEEMMEYRRTLTNLFAARNQDIIFFEVAKSLHRFAHMKIECIPIEKDVGDLAPIYFKKAIDESETEWATNKKLVSLEGRNVRRAIPKGLPYFFVSFGMQEGYAHVIEDEESFPGNFAQEIIGGMLDLQHTKWRKPRQQSFDEQSERVNQFNHWWTEFNRN